MKRPVSQSDYNLVSQCRTYPTSIEPTAKTGLLFFEFWRPVVTTTNKIFKCCSSIEGLLLILKEKKSAFSKQHNFFFFYILFFRDTLQA